MRGVTRFEIVVIVVLLVAAVLVVLPALQRSRDTGHVPAPEYMCANHLKQIALGLHSYHDEHGSFPPAWVVAEDGMTRHSWRVMALPFLDEHSLYHQYQLDEPWNGETNRVLHDQLFGRYAFHNCPSDDIDTARAGFTNYLAIVGPNTAWRGTEPVSLADVTDRTDQTILLVEVADSNVNWFEPRDLEWDQLSFRINDPDSLSPGGPHEHEFWFGANTPYINVLMVDGAVRRLPIDTPPETLKALLTIDGGESINDPFLP